MVAGKKKLKIFSGMLTFGSFQKNFSSLSITLRGEKIEKICSKWLPFYCFRRLALEGAFFRFLYEDA